MLKPLINFVVQHIMQQNAWSAPHLQAFSGNTISIDFKVAQVALTILENGQLALAPDSAQADAVIHLPPSLAMRLIRNEAEAMSLVKIDGNASLGIEVSKILSAVRWDYEGDLSHVVGDMAAYSMVKLGQQKVQSILNTGRNLSEMLVEYWQEEKPTVAKPSQVQAFNQAVDTLREDADRLEKRVNRLLNNCE